MRYAAVVVLMALSALLLAQGPPSYQKIWVADTGDWNQGIAVMPSGDVVSLTSQSLRVHARDTGKVLETRPSGAALPHALCFSGSALLLVCEDRVKEITWPGGAERTVVTFPSRASAGAVAPGWAAVADRNGNVQIYSLKEGTLAATFEAGGEVEGLAVAPDGRCALAREDGAVLLIDPQERQQRTLWPGDGSGTRGIAFSPGGKRLFAAAGTFKAVLWESSTGSTVAEYRTGSWITSARFVSPDVIAAAGSDGLVLYEKPGEPTRKLSYSTGSFAPSCEGLGVSQDGMVLCTGDRDGLVACFSAAPVKPSEYVAPPEQQAGSAASAQKPQAEITGTLESRKGASVRIKLDGGAALPAGSRGTLYKHFEKEFAGFKTTGWLEIAAVAVRKASGPSADLEILEKRSVITKNGREVDHFTPGVRVKIEVAAATP